MWLLFCLLLLLLPLLLLLLFFARADGDFTLMSKGRTPTSAVEDKVVWITGASQGIGEALAKEYARLGAKLILSSRRPFELERVKSELVGKRVASQLLENEFHSKSSVLVHGPRKKHWDFYVSL
jgi:dehydrogenase/reductase SDR family protein 7